MSSGNILTHLTVLWHATCLLLLNFVITARELIWCFFIIMVKVKKVTDEYMLILYSY